MATLTKYKNIIDGKPVHIATVTAEGNPNLAVAADVKVLDDVHLVICVNEMVRTQENIQHNPKVVMTAFDKDWKGVRIFGEAEYHEDGEYYEICRRTFFGNGEVSSLGATKPQGVILVTTIETEDYA